ncbi:DUF806 family protein [Lactococcus taiwanensis]|uniref:DUF806 family protein n=1 Tax=Lactococcus taiwanensis TaxID=1151742 RepID=UPI00289E8C06|nr:DUF806 family protein [Lactococcus taiwanensis]
MRPTQEVAKIIAAYRPTWLVFEDSIPEEKINDLKNTQVLLRETKSDISHYGDDTFNAVDLAVTIQIFYGFNLAESMLLAEVGLMKSLEKSNWKTTASEPHYLDISTNTDKQQMIKNLTVEKTVNIAEIGEN